MNNIEFIVLVPHYWGRGETIPKAKQACRREGYAGRFPHKQTLIYSVPTQCELWVDELGRMHWKGTEEDLKVINR